MKYFDVDDKLIKHRHEMLDMLLLAIDAIEELDSERTKAKVLNKLDAFTDKVMAVSGGKDKTCGASR